MGHITCDGGSNVGHVTCEGGSNVGHVTCEGGRVMYKRVLEVRLRKRKPLKTYTDGKIY